MLLACDTPVHGLLEYLLAGGCAVGLHLVLCRDQVLCVCRRIWQQVRVRR